MESNDEETQVNDESMEIENKLKICILHVGDSENEGDIKSFTESKWERSNPPSNVNNGRKKQV